MKQTQSFGLLGRLFSTRTSKQNADSTLAPAVTDERDDRAFERLDLAQDSPQAVARLEKAAETGDPVAQNCLGLRLFEGAGLRGSDEQARKWLRRAAQQGYAEAQ